MAHVDVAGGRLFVEVDGDDDAPPVVLLHADVATSRMWDPLVPVLAADHRVVRFDRRGSGRSSTRATVFDPRQDLVEVLDRLGVSRAVVVGAAEGGRLALDLALARPERVAGLVLLAPGVSGAPDPVLTLQEQRAADEVGRAREAGDARALVEATVALRSVGPSRASGGPGPDVAARLLELHAENVDHVLGRLAPREPERPAWDRLGQVRVPSLVVVGDDGLVAERQVATHVASHLPDVTFVLVEGAGHLPSVERPDEVAASVRRWLAAYGL